MTRVAVITPYFRTPDDWLRKCYASVRRQTHACTHIFVADGEPQEVVDGFEGVQHIRLPLNHNDYGDTPRAVAGMTAIGQGFDAIAYLDADNWWRIRHVERLLELQASTGAAVVTAMRSFHDLEGAPFGVCLASDGEVFTDTSCLMLMRPAFDVASLWATMEPEFHAIDDRVIWHEILQRGWPRAHLRAATVCYRVKDPGIYTGFGLPVPEGLKRNPALGQAVRHWAALGRPPLKVSWRALGMKQLEARGIRL